ncbi:hypothetical protein Y043_6317 [Burkholderia pseudomallei MSHR2138]|nr:hypothetical protein Y043_6317 [Burkholderia pseudomallei MSHR2138]
MAFDVSLPPRFVIESAALTLRPVWPDAEPAELSIVLPCRTVRPLLAMAPALLLTVPEPLPTISVPGPTCVIVPPLSLIRVVDVSDRSVLRVWIRPLFELSRVSVIATVIGPVPVCVTVPPWFSNVVPFSETVAALTVPWELSSVAPFNTAL